MRASVQPGFILAAVVIGLSSHLQAARAQTFDDCGVIECSNDCVPSALAGSSCGWDSTLQPERCVDGQVTTIEEANRGSCPGQQTNATISSNPTIVPTSAPITPSPTASPSKVPSESTSLTAVTDSPTTLSPSASPMQSPVTSPTASPTQTPANSPTALPTSSPPTSPPQSPVTSPTASPTQTEESPTISPTGSPAESPTTSPSASTSSAPSGTPSTAPSVSPTHAPTSDPTAHPTMAPTSPPTAEPTGSPSVSPTSTPTALPSLSPIAMPTTAPTAPTASPTIDCFGTGEHDCKYTDGFEHCGWDSSIGCLFCGLSASEFACDSLSCCAWDGGACLPELCTFSPTLAPTASPTFGPTAAPTTLPTALPTSEPTAIPSVTPTASPTFGPTATPTTAPTAFPTSQPTAIPSVAPTAFPTFEPTATPTAVPTALPTGMPTLMPSAEPTEAPTTKAPTNSPSARPTPAPSAYPTGAPTVVPSSAPTATPTATPSAAPTKAPSTATPTEQPSASPTPTGNCFGANEYNCSFNVAFSHCGWALNGAGCRQCSIASTEDFCDNLSCCRWENDRCGAAVCATTRSPSTSPTSSPTTNEPTGAPSKSPTGTPTASPTVVPSAAPSPSPTATPTATPTAIPSNEPTSIPTAEPTTVPTTMAPSAIPTRAPTGVSFIAISEVPTIMISPMDASTLRLPIRVSWHADGEFRGMNVSLITVVANATTSRGFHRGAFIEGSTSTPVNLGPAGDVNLAIQLTNKAVPAATYTVKMALTTTNGGWAGRFAESATWSFAIVAATSAPTMAPTMAPTCIQGGADVAFVIDRSAAVSVNELTAFKSFVKSTVRSLSAGSRVAILTASTPLAAPLLFDGDQSLTSIDSAVDGIVVPSGARDTAAALNFMSTIAFTTEHGARSVIEAARIVVVLSGGAATEQTGRVLSAADSLQLTTRAVTIAIGLGPLSTEPSLQAIAGATGHVARTSIDLLSTTTPIIVNHACTTNLPPWQSELVCIPVPLGTRNLSVLGFGHGDCLVGTEYLRAALELCSHATPGYSAAPVSCSSHTLSGSDNSSILDMGCSGSGNNADILNAMVRLHGGQADADVLVSECRATSEFMVFDDDLGTQSCAATALRINVAIAAIWSPGSGFESCGSIATSAGTSQQSPATTTTAATTVTSMTATTDTFQGAFECVDSVRSFGAPISLIGFTAGNVCSTQLAVLNSLIAECGGTPTNDSNLVSCGTAPVLAGRVVINGGCRSAFDSQVAINRVLSVYHSESEASLGLDTDASQVFCGFETDFVQMDTVNCSAAVASLNAAVEAHRSGQFNSCEFTTPTTTATSTATTTATTALRSRWECFDNATETVEALLMTDNAEDCSTYITVLNAAAVACSAATLTMPLSCASVARLDGSFVNASWSAGSGSSATAALQTALVHFQSVSQELTHVAPEGVGRSQISNLVTLGDSPRCDDRADLLNRATMAHMDGEWLPCVPQVEVVSVPPTLSRRLSVSTWAGPIRVQWRAQGSQTNTNLSMIVVVRNARTSWGLLRGVRTVGSHAPLTNLAPSGALDIEILLSTNAEAAAGYSIGVALTPVAGGWNERFAQSEKPEFAVVVPTFPPTPAPIPVATTGSIDISALPAVVPVYLCGGRAVISLVANYTADANVTIRAVVRSLARGGGVVNSFRLHDASSPTNIGSSGVLGLNIEFGGWVQTPSYGSRFSVQLWLTNAAGVWSDRFAASARHEIELVSMPAIDTLSSSAVSTVFSPQAVIRPVSGGPVTLTAVVAFTAETAPTFIAVVRSVGNVNGPNQALSVHVLGSEAAATTECGSVVLRVELRGDTPVGLNYTLEVHLTDATGMWASRHAVATPVVFLYSNAISQTNVRISSIPLTVTRPLGASIWFGPITVVWAIDPALSTSNVSLITIVQNDRTNSGLVIGVRVLGTRHSPVNLLPLGSTTLELRLSRSTEASSTYTVHFAIIPVNGDWSDRLTVSPPVPFSVLHPSESPTEEPTASPTTTPTRLPTSVAPSSIAPTSRAPTNLPTLPTLQPVTASPTAMPSSTTSPTIISTSASPSTSPTVSTASPTRSPTSGPTLNPSNNPTDFPTTTAPTAVPSTTIPTEAPSTRPTAAPTVQPTAQPSQQPTTSSPTGAPTTTSPSAIPTPACPPFSAASNVADVYPADNQAFAAALNASMHLQGSFRFPPTGSYDNSQGRSNFATDCAAACCAAAGCNFFVVHVAATSPAVYGCYLLESSGGLVDTPQTMYGYSVASIVTPTGNASRDYCHNACESPSFNVLPSGARCHCDELCVSGSDCCPDYRDLCTGTPPGFAGAEGLDRAVTTTSPSAGVGGSGGVGTPGIVVGVLVVVALAALVVLKNRHNRQRLDSVHILGPLPNSFEDESQTPSAPRLAFSEGMVAESLL